MTELHVAKRAKNPGYEFQVGKVQQPIIRLMPRGTTRYRFSILSGSFLPWGFSQRAVFGMRFISVQAYATASRPGSWACGPPPSTAIIKACPEVCITA